MSANKLTNKVFKEIYFTAFKRYPIKLGIKKLSGGLKNRVYLLDAGNKKYIIKTEPVNKKISPIDKNTIYWEAKILKELEGIIPNIPKVIFYSDGIDLYKYPFLIISYIEGNNYNECKENISKEQKQKISYEIGKITKKICSIKKDKFFIPAFPEKHFSNNYELVMFMFDIVLKIYQNHHINIEGITSKDIINLLKTKEKELKNINNISLCNIDLWDGNILIKNGQINGIIDFNDTFFCDELMSFYFHLLDRENDEYFLLGYDNKKLTHDEIIRIEIYRLYSLLKIITDCEIKNYGRFSDIYTKFSKQYSKLLAI